VTTGDVVVVDVGLYDEGHGHTQAANDLFDPVDVTLRVDDRGVPRE